MTLSNISLYKFLLAISIVVAICFGTVSLATLNAANTSDPDNYARVKAKLPIIADEAKSEKLTTANEEATTPIHNPEWTNYNESDPGTTDNSQDAKHKDWIEVLSLSNSSSKDETAKAALDAFQKKKKLDTDGIVGANTVEKEMKESGEKGGTEDINIGLGELQEMKGDFTRSQMPIRKKPGRTTYRGTDNNLKLTQPPLTYVCEGGGASDECFCDGVLDCNNLWTSGDCKDDTEWQDGNDSSKGGCTAAD